MYLFICIHCWYLTGGCFHTDGSTVKILESAVLLPASERLTAKSISFGLHAILHYYFQDLHMVLMTTLSLSRCILIRTIFTAQFSLPLTFCLACPWSLSAFFLSNLSSLSFTSPCHVYQSNYSINTLCLLIYLYITYRGSTQPNVNSKWFCE